MRLTMSGLSEIYVVKDDGPPKQALTSLLTTAGFPSRTFDSASVFLEACGRLPPGCVITSLQTRGMDALEFLRRLSAEPVSFPAVVIASSGDVLRTVEAMKAGAATVLERPYGDEVLIGAVRSALEADVRGAAQTAQRSVLAMLTPREDEVLSGLLKGKTNKVIAGDLGISPRTIEVYRASVMKKAGVSSLPELVRLAVSAQRLH
jgi:two-component system, LuxR family, response regulator FixJ